MGGSGWTAYDTPSVRQGTRSWGTPRSETFIQGIQDCPGHGSPHGAKTESNPHSSWSPRPGSIDFKLCKLRQHQSLSRICGRLNANVSQGGSLCVCACVRLELYPDGDLHIPSWFLVLCIHPVEPVSKTLSYTDPHWSACRIDEQIPCIRRRPIFGLRLCETAWDAPCQTISLGVVLLTRIVLVRCLPRDGLGKLVLQGGQRGGRAQQVGVDFMLPTLSPSLEPFVLRWQVLVDDKADASRSGKFNMPNQVQIQLQPRQSSGSGL